MSPYFGKDFFQFFPIFFSRCFQLLVGNLSLGELATDEIQVFVLSFISIAASLVGTFLILKKMSMLANSLSHTILLGIVLAYILLHSTGMDLSTLLIGSLIAALLTTIFTQFFHHILRLQEDASIGIVFTSFFALGILLVTLYTRSSHIGLEAVMGNADALHLDDMKIAFSVAAINALCVTLFFKEFRLVCFDSPLAASMGFRPSLFHYFLMFLTSLTAVSAFRAVGVLLFLSFLVGLPLSARMLTANLKKLLLLSCGLGIIASIFGVALARHFLTVYRVPLSTGGLVSSLIGITFVLSALMRRLTFRQISP